MSSNHDRRQFFKRAITLTAGVAALPLMSSCAGTTRTGSAMKPMAAKAAAPQSMAKEHIVEIQSFQYAPKALNVKAGDTVTWVNRDSAPHTATAADGTWDTGSIAQGGRKSMVMTAGMVASYYCVFHPNMRGTATVS